MDKRIFPAVMIVLLVAAVFVGTVSAKQRQVEVENRKQPFTIGQVISVENSQFAIEKPDGNQVMVQVIENTRFQSRVEQQEVGFEDLYDGVWVAVIGRTDENGVITANLVVLLPEDFDPEAHHGRRVMGEVTQINNGQDTFTIATRSQEEITFQVDESTRYLNGIGELQDLEKGMLVGILAFEPQDGNPLAKVVAAASINQNQPRKRLAGKVETVSTNSLTLMIRGGRRQAFTLTEDTNFRSLDGSIENVQDLESEHVVVVVFEGDDTSGFTALNVIASGEVFNQAVNRLRRVGGEVQSAGGSHLTIQTHTGEKIDFMVGENIHIRGVNGEAEINDLKNGMRVVVLYHTGEGGDLVARVILFGERDNPDLPNGRLQIPGEGINDPPAPPEW